MSIQKKSGDTCTIKGTIKNRVYEKELARFIDLSEWPKVGIGYVRPPMEDQEFVAEIF